MCGFIVSVWNYAVVIVLVLLTGEYGLFREAGAGLPGTVHSE